MPFGAGREQKLTHGGKVVKKKVLQSGNFGEFLGNSDQKDGPGKKIGDTVADDEAQVFSEVQASFQESKPNPAILQILLRVLQIENLQ